MKAATSRRVRLRGLDHHVLTWGDAGSPKLFLLHGWMDVGASFQFLVDALAGTWHAIAPDLRGYGRSEWQPQGYWFPDYIADLEALVDAFAPGEAVDLVGHSLGGNVAMMYAGARPARVCHLVSLEGFGIPAQSPDVAPKKIGAWLDALADPPSFVPYANIDAVADRLQKTNARLPRDKALFLAGHWAETTADGRARLRSDPRHKLPFPTAAGDANPDGLDGVRRRMAHVAGARLVVIPDAAHMLHHDQPRATAMAIETFLSESTAQR